MNKRPMETIMGIVVLVVAAFFVYFAYKVSDLQVVKGYEVTARFLKVGGLNVGSDVRINGIKVGTVVAQKLDTENYDAEIVATLARAYESIAEFIGPVNIRIGNRRFWNAMFEYLKLTPEQSRNAFILIDKKDKISDFYDGLVETVGNAAADVINNVFSQGYKSFVGVTNELDAAVREIDDFVVLLDSMGITNATIDLGIMRGHAYYTGIVFEFFLDTDFKRDVVYFAH